jgi:hypothetical protein
VGTRWKVHIRVAVAAATEAQARGLVTVTAPEQIETDARRVMQAARESSAALVRAGLIQDVEEAD